MIGGRILDFNFCCAVTKLCFCKLLSIKQPANLKFLVLRVVTTLEELKLFQQIYEDDVISHSAREVQRGA